MLCILGLIIYSEHRIRKTSNLTQSLKQEDHWVEAMKTHDSGLCATTQLLVCIPIILTIQGCAIPYVVFCCLHTCYKCLLSKIMTRRKRRCSSNNNEFFIAYWHNTMHCNHQIISTPHYNEISWTTTKYNEYT